MPPSPLPTRGIDVSHHDGRIDWKAVAAATAATPASGSPKIDFVFLKATEGQNYTDPTFAAHWKGAQEAGLLTGAYHFFRARQDPRAQADHLLATLEHVGGLQSDNLPPVLDIESADGVSRSVVVHAAHLFLERVEQATGRRPILYTYPAFAEESLDASFGDYPLWIAHYGITTPRIPAGWRTYLLWQTVAGEAGGWTVPGCPSPVDGNVYRGTREQFVAALGGGPVGSTAPESPQMNRGDSSQSLVYVNDKLATTAWLNPADGTHYAPVRQLLERLFTPGQVNTLLSFDAARRPLWNGKPLATPFLYRPTGEGGASQLWVQVRGFATAFGLTLDTPASPRTLTLRRSAGD